MSDLIERQAAVEKLKRMATQAYIDKLNGKAETIINCCIDVIERQIPSAQPEIVRCKDCKYFELDHFEKVEGFPVPIIVAHEICMKWSDGCRTSKDGWCFMGERRTDERSD